jgi:hypothetical protein
LFLNAEKASFITAKTEKPFRPSRSHKKWEQGFPDYDALVKEGVYIPHYETANRKNEKIKKM